MPQYLGNPAGFGMVKLPYCPPGYSTPFRRGVIEHPLIGDGASITRGLTSRRRFQFDYTALASTELDPVLGFYNGAQGAGPYVLIDTTWDNLLPLDASLLGSRRGVLTDWVATVGTATYDATIAPFQAPGGVARWAGAGNGSQFGCGLLVAGAVEPDLTDGIPYIPAEAVTVSFDAKTASSTASVTARVSGRNAAHSVHVEAAGTPVTLTTSYQRVTVSAAANLAGLATAQWILPSLLCNTASAPDILISNPQISFSAGTVFRVNGVGVPRVLPTGDFTAILQRYPLRNVSLQLVEI